MGEKLEHEAAIKIQTQVRIFFAKKLLAALRLAREREIMSIFGELSAGFSVMTKSDFKENAALPKNDYMEKFAGLKHLYHEGEMPEYAIKAAIKIQSHFRRKIAQR